MKFTKETIIKEDGRLLTYYHFQTVIKVKKQPVKEKDEQGIISGYAEKK